MIYVDVKNILVLEDNGKQIQMNLIPINIKTTLGPVLIINWYVSMISLAKCCSYVFDKYGRRK